MAGRHLTIEEAAKYIHIPATTLTRLVKQEEIPYIRHGERIAFDAEELDAWASQKILGMGAKPLNEYHREATKDTRQSAGDVDLIKDYFRPATMKINLSSRTKAAVLRDLVTMVDKAELLYSASDLVDSLVAREAICSTGLTGGVALVHPRNHDPYLAPESFIALARTLTPIPFGAPDGKNTDIFFLICCLDDRLHLHILARLCAMINTTQLLENIRMAEDSDELYNAVIEAEQLVVAQLRDR